MINYFAETFCNDIQFKHLQSCSLCHHLSQTWYWYGTISWHITITHTHTHKRTMRGDTLKTLSTNQTDLPYVFGDPVLC